MATVTVSHVCSMGLEHKYIHVYRFEYSHAYCSNKNLLFMIPEIESDTSGTLASLQIFTIGLKFIIILILCLPYQSTVHLESHHGKPASSFSHYAVHYLETHC